MFHLLESRLYNISEKFAESAAHLHSVSYIFSTSAAKSHSMKADRQIEKPTQEGSESPEGKNCLKNTFSILSSGHYTL